MSVGWEAKQVEGPVVRWADRNKWLHLKINVLGNRGWPDHFFFGYPKILVMIEFKAPGHKPKPHQERVHRLLRMVGWPVYVVHTKEQGIRILQEEREHAQKANRGTGDV